MARRSAERWRKGLLDPQRVIQIGIRGTTNDPDMWGFSQRSGMRVLPMEEFDDKGWRYAAEEARRVAGAGPTYLTFDIDSLDPSQAPGTGTPEAGGMTALQAMRLLRELRGIDFVGGDLVEVSPPFDVGIADRVQRRVGAVRDPVPADRGVGDAAARRPRRHCDARLWRPEELRPQQATVCSREPVGAGHGRSGRNDDGRVPRRRVLVEAEATAKAERKQGGEQQFFHGDSSFQTDRITWLYRSPRNNTVLKWLMRRVERVRSAAKWHCAIRRQWLCRYRGLFFAGGVMAGQQGRDEHQARQQACSPG